QGDVRARTARTDSYGIQFAAHSIIPPSRNHPVAWIDAPRPGAPASVRPAGCCPDSGNEGEAFEALPGLTTPVTPPFPASGRRPEGVGPVARKAFANDSPSRAIFLPASPRLLDPQPRSMNKARVPMGAGLRNERAARLIGTLCGPAIPLNGSASTCPGS